MKVCVVGGGGREAAFAYRFAQTAEVVRWAGPTDAAQHPAELGADLYVIGPENYLAAGLADELRAAGLLAFGPGADGALLETSKAYMKEVVTLAGVPTAGFRLFGETSGDPTAYADELAAATKHLRTLGPPYVIKTDGLAAGKGVLVTNFLGEAFADIEAKLSGAAFGDAGRRVLIEEGLHGKEVSVFAICDGTTAHVIPTVARDYKRLGDGNTGPNTGGMGTFSPVDSLSPADIAELAELTIDPTLAELRRRGIDYRGFLYAGIMLTREGPKLLEFNVRFGDPEAQVIIPRLTGDVATLVASAAAGRMEGTIGVSPDAMVCVTCAAPGYPTAPVTGQQVNGLVPATSSDGTPTGQFKLAQPRPDDDEVTAAASTLVFGAGASVGPDGTVVTTGGRALSVCGRAPSVAEARRAAYAAVSQISFDGMQFRTDIAAA